MQWILNFVQLGFENVTATDAEWAAACFALWPTIRYNYPLQSGRCKNCPGRTSWHNTSPAPAVIYTNVKRHQNQLNFMKQKMSLVKFRPFILLHWSPCRAGQAKPVPLFNCAPYLSPSSQAAKYEALPCCCCCPANLFEICRVEMKRKIELREHEQMSFIPT